ncbi:nuclear pore protein 84/107 [Sparassis latifolia]
MSEALYASCAEALSACQSTKDDLAALLHPETGFAPRLRQICHDRLADVERDYAIDEPVSLHEQQALRMESDTWALLQALIPLRKTIPQQYPDPRALLATNPYTPPASLAQSIMHASPLLSALVVVREWLHESAPNPSALSPGAATGYWKFTRHVVTQDKRTGQTGGGVIGEMDPDAVNRTGNDRKTLAVDDATYDKALVQTLFAQVRAGQLDEAVELCRRAHQPWRAASIRGALLFQWRAIANEPREDDMMEEDGVDDYSGWRGNLHRKLWKSTCTRAALTQNLSVVERALYAALAPSAQTSGPLGAVCRTWSDHLWAMVSVACEDRLSSGLAGLESECFWEGGQAVVEVPENLTRKPTEGSFQEKEEEEWEGAVFKGLESLSDVNVEEGPPATNPYHVTQLLIILDRTDQLLQAFATGLRSGLYDPTLPEYPTMTRFFAHLCLFLQMIEINVPPLAMQVILEAYLQVLEAAGQRELIAMYAGALGDNAIERYAMFLTSLELSADLEERRLALNRAREHGLDMHRVAIVTAERTIETAFSVLSAAKGPLPSIIGMQPPPTDAELLLVRSIEWTTFVHATFNTALEQANIILRYFLGCGRVRLAKQLLDKLPPELGAIREPEARANEYYHYRRFFLVWESLERVVECQALEVSQLNKDARVAWLSHYKVLLEQAREQVLNLLTTDWLVSDVERNGNDRRRQELIRIRQIFIPELIIRLHAMLYASRVKFPENLKHALSLANVVADSRYKLYEDFVGQDGRRLGDYLGALRQAILGGLEGGGSDPFRALSL